MTIAQEIYANTISQWPVPERLRLAALILAEVVTVPQVLDVSDAWSDEDQQDLALYALAYADENYDAAH